VIEKRNHAEAMIVNPFHQFVLMDPNLGISILW